MTAKFMGMQLFEYINSFPLQLNKQPKFGKNQEHQYLPFWLKINNIKELPTT